MVNSELDIKSFYPDVTTHDPFIKFTLKNTSVNDKIAKSFEVKRDLSFCIKDISAQSEVSPNLPKVYSFNDMKKNNVAWQSFLASHKENLNTSRSSRTNTPSASRRHIPLVTTGSIIATKTVKPSRDATPRNLNVEALSNHSSEQISSKHSSDPPNSNEVNKNKRKRLKKCNDWICEAPNPDCSDDEFPPPSKQSRFMDDEYIPSSPPLNSNSCNISNTSHDSPKDWSSSSPMDDDNGERFSSPLVQNSLIFHYLDENASPETNWVKVQQNLADVVFTMIESMEKVDALTAEIVEICKRHYSGKTNAEIMLNMMDYLWKMGKLLLIYFNDNVFNDNIFILLKRNV